MITTKTFVEDDTQVSFRKIDVITENSDCVVGLRVTDLNGLVEVSIDPKTKQPYFTRRRLFDLSDDDRKEILRVGYKNFKSPWTEEDDFELITLYKKFNGNEREIAQVMQRTDNAIRLRLRALGVQLNHKIFKSRKPLQTQFQGISETTRQHREKLPPKRRRKRRGNNR